MLATAFWKAVTMDRSDFLDRLIALLAAEGIRYCVVGGQAVNAYAEPVVSLDLDLVVTVNDLARAEVRLAAAFTVTRHPHSLNVSEAGSDLRVQIQTDLRYAPFVDRATPRTVLGIALPVAANEASPRQAAGYPSDPVEYLEFNRDSGGRTLECPIRHRYVPATPWRPRSAASRGESTRDD